MFYVYFFMYLVVLPITFIIFFWKILNRLDRIEEAQQKQEIKTEEKKVTRKHRTIAHSNYENAFGGRKAYEKYKNNDGLYEPITPSKGISLKDKKKEE